MTLFGLLRRERNSVLVCLVESFSWSRTGEYISRNWQDTLCTLPLRRRLLWRLRHVNISWGFGADLETERCGCKSLSLCTRWAFVGLLHSSARYPWSHDDDGWVMLIRSISRPIYSKLAFLAKLHVGVSSATSPNLVPAAQKKFGLEICQRLFLLQTRWWTLSLVNPSKVETSSIASNMGTGKKEAARKVRQGKTSDGMANVKTKGENFYRYV